MISIIAYKHSKDFYRRLRDFNASGKKMLFVTPSPTLADNLRATLDKYNSDIEFESMTISFFTKRYLSKLYPDQEIELVNKSQLIERLLFALKENKVFVGKGLFDKAFELVTELRSYTLDQTVMESILEETDETLKKLILFFNAYIESHDLVDEQKAYHLLTDQFHEYKGLESICFSLFDFVSASQVDLIKSIAIQNQLYLPLPEIILDEMKTSDWPSWFFTDDKEVIYTKGEELGFHAKLFNFNSLYLNHNLNMVIDKNKPAKIILTKSQENINDLVELKRGRCFFKTDQSLFDQLAKNIFFDLKSMVEDKIMLKELESYLLARGKESLKDKDFRKFKIFSLIIKIIKRWEEIYDYSYISKYDLAFIEEVTLLDLPRTSYVMASDSYDNDIENLKNIVDIAQENQHILCIKQSYGDLASRPRYYGEKFEKEISALGPRKNSQLESLFKKQKIKEILDLKDSAVLLEEGLLDHSEVWKEIFEEHREAFQSFETTNKKISYPMIEYRNYELKALSATKLQTYIDCPQKFYQKYVEKNDPHIVLEREMNFLELGRIHHRVIELFFEKNSTYNSDELSELIRKTLLEVKTTDSYVESFDYLKIFNEVFYAAETFLKRLYDFYTDSTQVKFESSFFRKDEVDLNGSIDCIIEDTNTLYLIDFKRSSSSIGSYSELINMQKIQLWFYLYILEKNFSSKRVIIGYVNLLKPEDSLFLFSDELDQREKEFLPGKKYELQQVESLTSFHKVYIEAISGIVQARFSPKPLNAKKCNYCILNNTCLKGVSVES